MKYSFPSGKLLPVSQLFAQNSLLVFETLKQNPCAINGFYKLHPPIP
jgi:hypothetical protein